MKKILEYIKFESIKRILKDVLTKRVLAIVLFSIVVIIFILSIMKLINKSKFQKATNYSANELENLRNNKIIEQQIEEEQKAKQEEEKNKKYQPLSESEIEEVEHIYKHSEPKRVFLTFDDGPTKQVTPYILNLLKQENIKANFFVLGLRVKENPEIVKQEYEAGHFIGNHGYSHEYSSIYESVNSVFTEFGQTNRLIRQAIGNDKFNTLVFRFPGGLAGGKYNDLKLEAAQKLKENGVANVDWNALTNDAGGAKTKEALLKNFYETIEDKTSVVLLMHDAADKILTYEVLPEIISYFRDNGFEFKTISDIIGR